MAKTDKSEQKGRPARHRWVMSRDERRAQRLGIALRCLVCVLVVGMTLALALVVGTVEYQASAVGWVPFIAVVTCLVVAFAYVQVLKRSLVLQEGAKVNDCRRNEEVNFRVRFVNRCPLFFFRVEAHFFTANMFGKPVSHTSTTLALAPFESYLMPFSARFDHVGTYVAGLDRVVIYDFLRLFSASIPGPRKTRIQVTPKLVAVPQLDYNNDAVVETTKAARSALSDSMDYAAVREYEMGDPMKNVHWKLSARSDGELYTKLFETYTNPGVAVVLDFYGPGSGALELSDMFDAVVECGFSIARDAQRQGMDAEVHYTDMAGARRHIAQWRERDLPQLIYEMPAFSAEPARANDALGLLEEQVYSPHGQSNVVVCTANLSPQMIETIVAAKVHQREPYVIAVVPQGLEGPEREQWLAPLARLDVAGIAYRVLATSEELTRGVR